MSSDEMILFFYSSTMSQRNNSLFQQLAEKNLMHDAVRQSEEFHIEQAMLEDKLKATDWEATNEAIEEQVARESYLQWLRDNDRRNHKASVSLY